MIDPQTEPAWTVPDFASPAECAEWIALVERTGPELATVNLAGGARIDESLRNNSRVIVDDQDLADSLLERVRPHAPGTMHDGSWRFHAVNERFRFYKYEPGQRFQLRHDGCFARSDDETSFLTFMIHLNDPEDGGETIFPELDLLVPAKTGHALFLQHSLLHEGTELKARLKYVLRSDLMYRRG